MAASIIQFRPPQNFLLNQILIVTDVPKYLNYATFSNGPFAILSRIPAGRQQHAISFSVFSSLLVFIKASVLLLVVILLCPNRRTTTAQPCS
jgi:hypothetical protein